MKIPSSLKDRVNSFKISLTDYFFLHGSENSEKEKCEPEKDEKIT